MDAILVVPLLLAGLTAGSFLGVCAYRLPRRESVLWPPSRCTSCGCPLAWNENLPVIGWMALVLFGRCRPCRVRVTVVSPLVELITAAVFVCGYAIYGWTPLLAARLLFASAMIVLFVMDLQHKILPNVVTLPGIVIGFILSFALPPGWGSSLAGILVGGGTLFAITEVLARTRGFEGFGMGDVKMLAMIGAFLGWPLVLLTLILASVSGSIVGLGVMSARRTFNATLPFGTFLAAGALVAAAAGPRILDWYIALYQ